MRIYLDVIFFVNYFFDFLLLLGTAYILKEKVKIYRIAIGSLIGGLSLFILFLKINSFQLFILKIIISMLMILVTFGSKNFYKNYLYFYIISIFAGGGMYLINNTFSYKHEGLIFFNNSLSINLIVLIICFPLIVYFYIKENKNYKNNISNIYLVDLFINKKNYKLRGYLDTGNTLIDPYKKRGVILLNLNKIKISDDKVIYVPYKTITSSGLLKCYKIDKVIINKREFNNILIGDVNNKFQLENSDCILPNMLKEDLC